MDFALYHRIWHVLSGSKLWFGCYILLKLAGEKEIKL